MYEAKEHWIAYQKEMKIKHNHEVIASISAIAFIVIIGILVVTFVK